MSLNSSFEIALIKGEVTHEVFYHRTIHLNMKRETIPIRQKPAIDDMSLESYSEGGFEDDLQPVAMNIHEFFFSHHYHNNTEHTAIYKQSLPTPFYTPLTLGPVWVIV